MKCGKVVSVFNSYMKYVCTRARVCDKIQHQHSNAGLHKLSPDTIWTEGSYWRCDIIQEHTANTQAFCRRRLHTDREKCKAALTAVDHQNNRQLWQNGSGFNKVCKWTTFLFLRAWTVIGISPGNGVSWTKGQSCPIADTAIGVWNVRPSLSLGDLRWADG